MNDLKVIQPHRLIMQLFHMTNSAGVRDTSVSSMLEHLAQLLSPPAFVSSGLKKAVLGYFYGNNPIRMR